jgi:putative hydrolase of the HAD superfamily
LTVKAVLFDLGNTLVYQNPYKTFQKILGTHGIIRTTEEIEEAFAKTGREFDIEKHSSFSAHEFYTQLNITILKHLGITHSNSLQALAEDIDIQWFKASKIYVYRDVKPTLAKLKKMGLKLGLITDGYESDLEKILPKVGFQKFFDVCVCGDTVGKRKPNPQVFKHALNQLNIQASEAIFVGDRLDTDYLGAKKAGMTPILIRREGNKQEVAGVRSITSLKEVFKILEAMEGEDKKA